MGRHEISGLPIGSGEKGGEVGKRMIYCCFFARRCTRSRFFDCREIIFGKGGEKSLECAQNQWDTEGVYLPALVAGLH